MIETYESHPFYATRFIRWAVIYRSTNSSHLERVLQQLWRTFDGREEWRDVPEVITTPNVTVEELPDSEPIPTSVPQNPTVFSSDPTSL